MDDLQKLKRKVLKRMEQKESYITTDFYNGVIYAFDIIEEEMKNTKNISKNEKEIN